MVTSSSAGQVPSDRGVVSYPVWDAARDASLINGLTGCVTFENIAFRFPKPNHNPGQQQVIQRTAVNYAMTSRADNRP